MWTKASGYSPGPWQVMRPGHGGEEVGRGQGEEQKRGTGTDTYPADAEQLLMISICTVMM